MPSWVSLDQVRVGLFIIKNNQFCHILKVSVQYLKFWLSYKYICFNWVAMVIIGHGNLGKFGSGEGCCFSRNPHDNVLEDLDSYH